MNLSPSKDYRMILKEILWEKKKILGKSFSYEKMSTYCQVHRPYLSAVLGRRAHLNSDQLYAACEYLEIDHRSSTAISLLYQMQRSENPNRKQQLLSEFETMQKLHLSSESHLKLKPKTLNEASEDYFLDPFAQIVHMSLLTRKYSTNLEKLRQLLGIDEKVFKSSIKVLESCGLISMTPSGLKVHEEVLHLKSSDRVMTSFRNQMRINGLQKLMQLDSDKKYSISVVFTANEASRKKILVEFLKFLEFAQINSQKAAQENVYQLNFDLFPWT